MLQLRNGPGLSGILSKTNFQGRRPPPAFFLPRDDRIAASHVLG
jgi:hypothetical protein